MIYNCRFCGKGIEIDDSTRSGDNVRCPFCNVTYPLPESAEVRRGGGETAEPASPPAGRAAPPPELPPDSSPDAEPGTAKKAAYGIFAFVEKAFLFFLLLLFLFGMMSGGSHNSAQYATTAKKRSCLANMKTVSGAAEIYNMEHVIANIPVYFFDIERDLRMQGYLKTAPKCPDSGKYTIKCSYVGGIGSTLEVSCSSHGDLSLLAP